MLAKLVNMSGKLVVLITLVLAISMLVNIPVSAAPKYAFPTQPGGLFVSLIGNDGMRYYGSHLSLEAWKAGKDLSPVSVVSAMRAKVGEVPKASQR